MEQNTEYTIHPRKNRPQSVAASSARDVSLLVFSDDWGRHPSSCQHLIRHLLARFPTFWINTIGMRKPSLDVATVTRAIEKFRHWTRGSSGLQESQHENLSVYNPWMWPAFSGHISRTLNRCLLSSQLRRWLSHHQGELVAVSTVPIVADLIGRLPVDRWVYYCVDDFSEWPGLDQKAMGQLEKAVIEKSDCLISAGESLQRRLRESGKTVHLLTHGVDLEHWNRPEIEPPDSGFPWEAFERPLVVFWGVVDQRMDPEFLCRLDNDLDQGTILLVGPQADPHPAVLQLPHVRLLPPVSYQDLPALGNHADVLVMPYADLPVTRAMQPLKLLEYLANQKPVVARDLPATRPWSDCLDLVTNPVQFSRRVRYSIAHGLADTHRLARRRVRDESWSAKAQELNRLLLETCRP